MKKGKSLLSGFFNGNETNSDRSKKRRKNGNTITEHSDDINHRILTVASTDEFSFKFSF